MALGKEVGLGPGHIVLDGDPAPFPQKRAEPPPNFSAHVYCGQTAGWIKMPLGTETDLDSGDFVLDGDTAPPPQKGGRVPNFRPVPIVAKRLYQDTTWHRGRPQSRRHCVRCVPSSPPLKGHSPNFRPMCVVAKLLDGLKCHLEWRYASAQAT